MWLSRLLPTTILISFCNLPEPRPSGLLGYDLRRNRSRWVELDSPTGTLTSSALGLDKNAQFIFHVDYVGDNQTRLTILVRRSLIPIYSELLPDVVDPHSLCVQDDRLFIVSTGTDEILEYSWSTRGVTGPRVTWRASETKCDTHHVNSVSIIDGELWCTAFGPKAGEKWSSARGGYVYNITKDAYVKQGIYHPHSLRAFRGSAWFCESSQSALANLDGEVCRVPGYVRGLDFLRNRYALIGSSVGRQSSIDPAVTNLPSDTGARVGICGLTIYDLKKHAIVQTIDLNAFAQEIYDILIV